MAEQQPTTTSHIDAVQVVGKIADSPEFARNREVGYSTQRAFARSALELAGMNHRTNIEDDYRPEASKLTAETALYAMVGSLPSLVYGLEGMQHHNQESKLPYQTFRSLKERAVQFNHATKTLIDRDPSIEFGKLSATIVGMYGLLNRDRWGNDQRGYYKEARQFKNQMEGRLRGMYQEVAAVAVINSMEGVDISVNPDVGAEDDLHGVDMWVTLDGVTFPVDIKASERTAHFARKKSDMPCSIITSGLPSPAYSDTFEVNPEAASAVADDLLDKLYAARTEFLATKLQTALA